MVVFGKVSSSAAAASRVISCAMIGLVSVIPEPSSWRQMNATVCDHNTRAEAETGAIDSNRRSAAGRPVRSSARWSATGRGTRTSANEQSCISAV